MQKASNVLIENNAMPSNFETMLKSVPNDGWGIGGSVVFDAAEDASLQLSTHIVKMSGTISKALGVVDTVQHFNAFTTNWGLGWAARTHDASLLVTDLIGFCARTPVTAPLRFIPALAQATDEASKYWANRFYGVQ